MRRSRAERGFSVALGLFVVVLAAYLFLSSPFFRLEKVLLRGDSRYAEADVLAIAGLQLGQNLFDIDLNTVKQRLAADVRIAQASVRRKLPSGLVVELHERRPVAALVAADRIWLVAADGRVIEEAMGPHSEVLIVLAHPPAQVQPGDPSQDPGLRAGAGLAAALPVHMKARVSEIRVDSIENLELGLRDGIVVKFGGWREVAEKVRILDQLLQQMQSTGAKAQVVDVSVPSSPTVH